MVEEAKEPAVPRALIVEDEAVLRLTFSRFLEGEGYEVASAPSCEEAVALLDGQVFDVIITDIILLGMTGVDLLRTVRERGLLTPVVMVTADPNVESASEAVRLGAFDYLSKPVTRDALLRVARLACDRKRLADERDHYAAQMDMYRRELEATFNSVNEGIITVDSEMLVGQINSAARKILGLPDSSFHEVPFSEILPGRLEPAERALEETLQTHTRVEDCRLEFRLDNGKERVLIASTTPLIDQRGGLFSSAVLVLRDVTRLVRLEKEIENRQQFHNLVGNSPRMQELFGLIEQLADTDSTVLVCGESGTGKELVASALHNSSGRSQGPFLKVNCAALSEDILESELFGHVKGAFTGAVKDRAGRFEAANGGTILLDEIGDICPRLQLRLLRVLQEREFERVGDSIPIKTDVRVIASTNQDLEQKIRDGEFRQDLYYRLNVVRIDIPPLRERRSDIPLLVDQFCRRYNAAFKKEVAGTAPETLQILMDYPWPGNVRELENCLERAFIVCGEPIIQPRHLPSELLDYAPAAGVQNQPAPMPGDDSGREQMLRILAQTDWNVAKSARLLGIARNTLYQRMKAMDIARP